MSRQPGLLSTAVRAHLPLVALIAAYFVLMGLLRAPEAPALQFNPARVFEVFRVVLPMFVLLGLIVLAFRLVTAQGPERPLVRLMRWARETPWADVILLRLPLGLAFLVANQFVYIALKINIPEVAPFSWDATFAELDRLIFLGTDAWRLTHAIFPTALATSIIDGLYIAWFFVVYLGFLTVAALPMTSEVRLGFFVAFGLGWSLGGSVMATWFSSAGPVYFERLYGDANFEPLMARLAAQGESYRIIALEVQEKLWAGYAGLGIPPVGISAFPSMHNCLTAVVACAAFRWNRVAGWLLTLFAAAIAIGSVHLGWHYAVDSIAGIVLGVALWPLGLLFARWWLRVAGVRQP